MLAIFTIYNYSSARKVVIELKKISRVICKVLAFSCAFTLSLGVPSVKVAGMDIDPTKDEQVEQFLSEQKSSSITEAMENNNIFYLKYKKGYAKVVRCKDSQYPNLQYECYKEGSTECVTIDGVFNELSRFLEINEDAEKNIDELAKLTDLSLNVILCYLAALVPVKWSEWSDEIKDLMGKFSNSSESRLKGKDRKDKIDEIKSMALAFYFIYY